MVVAGAGRSDARADGASERWTIQLAGLLLLAAIAAGLLGQGAYYPSVQRPFAMLIAVATLLGLAGRPLTRDELRLLPVVPALALAAWAVLDGALVGVAGAGVRPALLLVGVVAVLVCRHLGHDDRELLLAGMIGIGLLVALTGWLGVAGRVGAWGFPAQGLWRASSTLTYPNATAAVLAPISLVVLGRLVGGPGSVPLALAATGLLTGLAATMSRAGALALVVGLVVLAGLRGLGVTARAVVGPVVGALVATIGLLPSMLAVGPPRPQLALVGLATGLTLAAMVGRARRWPALALLGGVLVAGVAGLLTAGGGMGDSAQQVTEARVNLASPDRTGAQQAALRLVAQHPLTGTGPGQADCVGRDTTMAPGCLPTSTTSISRWRPSSVWSGSPSSPSCWSRSCACLWRARPTGPAGATWAGVVAAAAAFAIHSGFDFVWHLPAIVVTVTLLVGLVLPPPDTGPAHKPSVPVQAKEPDENQAAH